MGRRRSGQPVHGWVSLDKPIGVTSTAAVARVRRVFDAAKAGHAGTLDPLAHGILPIALGEATKTAPHLVDARKRYRFQVQWGQARSTDDLEGEVVEMSKYRPKESQIVAALPAFVGQIQQIPPKFSAVKIDGHRAYALARKGVDVALTARSVEIFSFELLRTENEDLAEFEIECGKGTYVRSLARDLAGKLGTCGFVAALERTQVGSFEKASSIGLENLEALGHSAAAREHLLPVETPLDDIPAVAVTGTDASRLRSGQAISLRAGMSAPTLGAVPHGTVLCQLGKGRPVALCEYERGQFRPFRVFNLH